jgi:sulfatase maturation enzyme AslB (radical SAM superfamily)
LNEIGIDKSVTSNGVNLTDEQIDFLKATDTKVKFSVHGIGENHNKLDGVNIFEKVNNNISRLVKANIRLTVNTMISAKNISAIDELINYSIHKGVKRIRFILFIPRGRGFSNEQSFLLTDKNKTEIKNKIALAKVQHKNILDIRFSDYYEHPYIVLEPDGKLIKELPYESNDEIIWEFKSKVHAIS